MSNSPEESMTMRGVRDVFDVVEAPQEPLVQELVHTLT